MMAVGVDRYSLDGVRLDRWLSRANEHPESVGLEETLHSHVKPQRRVNWWHVITGKDIPQRAQNPHKKVDAIFHSKTAHFGRYSDKLTRV